MRIEPGQHAVDRPFEQLAVVRLLDVVGTYTLEHIAEQAELPVGVGGRRCCARSIEYESGLNGDERQGCACRCTEQDERSFAHRPRTSHSFSGLGGYHRSMLENA